MYKALYSIFIVHQHEHIMIFRLARHSNNIAGLEHFYTSILGLDVLGRFADHDGYDGVFLGREGLPWHLEFTKSTEVPNHKPDSDDALVFYPVSQRDYDDIVHRIELASIPRVVPKNPYWQANGIQVSDPDGFFVIVSPLRIESPGC